MTQHTIDTRRKNMRMFKGFRLVYEYYRQWCICIIIIYFVSYLYE